MKTEAEVKTVSEVRVNYTYLDASFNVQVRLVATFVEVTYELQLLIALF